MFSSLRFKLWIIPAALGLLLPLQAQAGAQETNPSAVIRVPVVVHGKHGELLPYLTASDFTLTDNTHPQTIQSFAPGANLPLTVGLLFETGPGQSSPLHEKVHASEQFLSRLLSKHASGGAPRVFVVQFHRDIDLLEDPSASESKAQQALSQVGEAQFHGDSNAETASVSPPNKRRHAKASGAALYEAIYLAAHNVLAHPTGRKAIIVLSDGIDRGSKTTLNGAVEAAQKAGVAIYAIYFKGGRPPMEFLPSNRNTGNRGYPGNYPGSYPGDYPGDTGNPMPGPSGERRVDGRKMLEELCSRTGGEMFDSRRQALPQIFVAVMQQLNEADILQYTRTKAATEPGFHHIRLKPKPKDVTVQMTEGYWLGDE
uniref:VWA domain-containing protein n=1 Tax=Acidobacterium capsulatum TaxID=33075 RepID=A0A7V4XSP4_9BACT